MATWTLTGNLRSSSSFDNTVALKPFRYALGATDKKPVDILVLGASLSEGYFATTDDRRWISLLRKALQAGFNPLGVPGGEGYIPAIHGSSGDNGYGFQPLPQRWTTTSTFTYAGSPFNGADNLFGLGRRNLRLQNPGEYAQITVFGDRFWVALTVGTGSGNAEVSVDGAVVATVNCYSSSGSIFTTYYDTGVLARGNHTIRVTTRVGTGGLTVTGVEGIMVFDGDGSPGAGAGKGVRLWDGARAGYKASDFMGPEQTAAGYWGATAIGATQPDLILMDFAGNEALASQPVTSFIADYQQLITYVKTKAPTAAIGLIGYHRPWGVTDAMWVQYQSAIKTLATTNGCAYLDLTNLNPWPTGAAPDDFYADFAHLQDSSSIVYANEVFDYLVGSASPLMGLLNRSAAATKITTAPNAAPPPVPSVGDLWVVPDQTANDVAVASELAYAENATNVPVPTSGGNTLIPATHISVPASTRPVVLRWSGNGVQTAAGTGVAALSLFETTGGTPVFVSNSFCALPGTATGQGSYFQFPMTQVRLGSTSSVRTFDLYVSVSALSGAPALSVLTQKDSGGQFQPWLQATGA